MTLPKFRTYALTQRAETELCEVCDGVGAVLAQEVYPGNQRVMKAIDGGEPKRVYVNDLSRVLIPCPGCYNHTGESK